MRALTAFGRVPALWGLAMVALYAPLAFIEPVREPPPPSCEDWLWCSDAYVGLAFNPLPDAAHLYALIALPNAFIAYFAAHVAGAPAPRRHWFMAAPLLALAASSLYFTLYPAHLIFLDTARSWPPAVWTVTLQFQLFMGYVLGSPAALLTLGGAAVWRAARRPAITP
jgi:hypothetical protein